MTLRAAALAVALCIVPLASACHGRGGNKDADADVVVAEIGGRAVTMAELDDWIKDGLFDRETSGRNPNRLYTVRQAGLKDLIDTRIVEAEAKRRGVTSDDLAKEAMKTATPVTDEEVSAFFEQNKSRLGAHKLEDLAPQIRKALERRHDLDAVATMVSSLREKAGITILLEPVRFDVAADGPSKGPDSAPVTIIEFSDFQCPYCKRERSVLDQVLERYPDDVRLVYRHYPLEQIHSHARAAAEASVCAQDQGKFWPYHDKLFANAPKLEAADLERYAGEVGMDMDAFRSCVADHKFRSKVDEDERAARKIGVTGTPAFVINGVMLSGAKPLTDFVSIIDAELAKKKTTETAASS